MDNINSPRLKTGITLQSGKYRIISELGQGGFGITYLAEHQVFGEVALKELFINSGTAHCSRENTTQRNVVAHFDAEQFMSFKKRFTDEAKTLFTLNGINGVVRVIDIFEENSTVYFSMEYLKGYKLEDYVKKRGRLSEAETLNILQQIGTTLAAVHEKKVLHRDIKPANIIITNDGRPFLIDFGIARTYAEDIGETHTTFHSPRYSPPEQKTAKSRMGTYSDVYALGATAYFMLTGEPPQSPEERIMGEYESPKSHVSNLSDTVNNAINASLTFKVQARPQTATDFLNQLNGRTSAAQNTPPQYKANSDATLTDNLGQKSSISLDNTRIQGTPQPSVNADKTQIQNGNPVVSSDKTQIQNEKAIVSSDKTQIQNDNPVASSDKTQIQPPPSPKPNPRNLTPEQKRARRIIVGASGATLVGVLIYWATLPSAPPHKMYEAPPKDSINIIAAPVTINADSLARKQALLDSLESVRLQDSIKNALQKGGKKGKNGKIIPYNPAETTTTTSPTTQPNMPTSPPYVAPKPAPTPAKPKVVVPPKSNEEKVRENLYGEWQRDNLAFLILPEGVCIEKKNNKSGSWLMSTASDNGTIMTITISNRTYKFRISNAFSKENMRLELYSEDGRSLSGKQFDKK